MYKIKQKPEDFIVKEISNVKLGDKGQYAVFLLKKIDYNTIDVIYKISDYLRIKPREISYAGNKDKVAVTEQHISVLNEFKDKLNKFKLHNAKLKFVGYSDEAIFLGNLVGNGFEIVVIELSEDEVNKFYSKYGKVNKIKIINYFGEQRFSKNNADVGKAIVKGDFKKAVELISETNNKLKQKFDEYLSERKNDYADALKLVPEKLLKLFVHAYQSKMWNDVAKDYVNNDKEKNIDIIKNIKIPILGFGSDIPDELENIYADVMKKESISQRNFIIRPLPHISQEGDERDLFTEAEEFKVLTKGKDFVKISFKLQKGSYATEVVRRVFE